MKKMLVLLAIVMSISQTEALHIFNERYRSPELKIHTIGDTDLERSERISIFGGLPPNAWFILFTLEDLPMLILSASGFWSAIISQYFILRANENVRHPEWSPVEKSFLTNHQMC